jgi:pimeloyl-ACP methyl ester carboxylesterase
MQNRHLLIVAVSLLAMIAVILGLILWFVPVGELTPVAMVDPEPEIVMETEEPEIPEPDTEVETPLAIEQDFDSMEVTGTELDGLVTVSNGWITNPTTGDKQSVRLYEPSEKGIWPMVTLVPGGAGDGTAFERESPGPRGGDAFAVSLADNGFVVVVYSPLGTGESEGDINYQGYDDQDGLASIIYAASQLPQVDDTNIGLASFSYGVTGASGVLARYPELGVKYWSDWEGPTSRYYITVGCPANREYEVETPAKFPCSADDHWAEREAVEFAKEIELAYYWRIQETKDHVQPTHGHTIEILDAALANPLMPWVKVNDAEVNTSFTEETLPTEDYLDKYEEAAIPHIVAMSELD